MIKFWLKSILRTDFIYKTNIRTNQQNVKLSNITISLSLHSVITEPKTVLYPLVATKLITGQTPIICKAKKSVAVLKLRKGMLIGTRVTLRKENAFSFLSLFVLAVLPACRSSKPYNLINEFYLSIKIDNLFLFPELNLFYSRFPKDINGIISIKTSTKNKQHCNLFCSGWLS